MDPIRVLHLASGDLWAGAEQQVFNLVTALDVRPDIDVTAVLLNDGALAAALREASIPVRVLPESHTSFVRLLFELRTIIRRNQVSVVHTHRRKENILGALAALFSGHAVSLRTVHGGDEFHPTIFQPHKRFVRSLDTLCGRYLQKRVVAVSDALANALTTRFSEPSIVTIENGIDVARFDRVASKKIAFNYKRDAIRVGLVGRLVPVKRADLFLEIAKILSSQSTPEFQFYVFGEGPLAQDIEAAISNNSLQDSVEMTGFQDPMAPFFQHLDALLITSDHEGLPMVLLEALAACVPVISHSVGGIPKVLGSGAFGTLISDQNPHRFAEALLDLAANRSSYRIRAQAGRRHVLSRYSSEVCAGHYADLYHDVVAPR